MQDLTVTVAHVARGNQTGTTVSYTVLFLQQPLLELKIETEQKFLDASNNTTAAI